MKLAVAQYHSYCSSRTNCEVDSSAASVAVEQILKLTVAQFL